jgi:hypothetical protein
MSRQKGKMRRCPPRPPQTACLLLALVLVLVLGLGLGLGLGLDY